MKCFIQTLFAVTLLLAINNVNAQVAGYMGKKLSVGYHLSALNPGPIFGDRVPFTYFKKHELSLFYTIGKKHSMGFTYSHRNSQIYLSSFQLGNEMQRFEPYTNLQNVQANFYEFNIKFFKSNFIAPIGSFIQFGFGPVQYKLADGQILGQKITITPPGTSEINPNYVYKHSTTYNAFKISFGLYNSKIITGNVYLNTGVQANLLAGGDIDGPSNTNSIYNEAHKYMGFILGSGIKKEHYFDFKLGIGLMLL